MRLLFLKKKQRLFSVFRTRRRSGIANERIEVLWFFLSRKNELPSLLTAICLPHRAWWKVQNTLASIGLTIARMNAVSQPVDMACLMPHFVGGEGFHRGRKGVGFDEAVMPDSKEAFGGAPNVAPDLY